MFMAQEIWKKAQINALGMEESAEELKTITEKSERAATLTLN